MEKHVIPTLEELSIGLAPFSPLGKEFLIGKIEDTSKLDEKDFRRKVPRFQKDAIEANLGGIKIRLKLKTTGLILFNRAFSTLYGR